MYNDLKKEDSKEKLKGLTGVLSEAKSRTESILTLKSVFNTETCIDLEVTQWYNELTHLCLIHI